MKKHIFVATLLSCIFAISLLIDLKLAVAFLLMASYLTILIRSEEIILKIYFFIYLVLVGFADKSSLSLSGNQSINLLGIFNLMLILIFYFKLLDFRQLKKEFWYKSLLYPIFLFMLYLVLTIPFSISLTTSIRGLTRLLSAFSFYLLAYFTIVNNKNASEKIFKFINVIFVPLLIFGLIEYLTQYNIFHGRSIASPVYQGWQIVGTFNRIRTTFLGAPHYSFIILTLFPLYLNYIMKKSENRNFYGFVLSLMLINVTLTFTRIAWIGIFIQLVIFLFLFRPKKILRFALPLGVMFVAMSGKIISRIAIFDKSASLRYDFFQYALSMFTSHPLFGAGIDAFWFLSEHQFGNTVAAHGDYMKIFAETGIFGGIGYLIILFIFLTFSVKNFKQNDFAKVSFLTIIGFMVFSIIDNGLVYCHIFWALLGIYSGLIVRKKFDEHTLILERNKTISNQSTYAAVS